MKYLHDFMQNGKLNNSKVILYGISDTAKRLRKVLIKNNIEIVGWIDSKSIDLNEKLFHTDFNYLLIAVTKYETQQEIKDFLIDFGVDSNKIICTIDGEKDYLENSLKKLLEDSAYIRAVISDLVMKEIEKNGRLYSQIVRLIEGKDWIDWDGRYYFSEWHINEEHKVAYLNMPKVACSAIKKSVKGSSLDWSEIALEKNVGMLPKPDEYFKFTYVRNPFARLVSCYCDKIENQQVSQMVSRANYGVEFLGTDEGFEKFVEKIVQIPEQWADNHFRNQYNIVYDDDGKCLVDYIGKIENLPDDYKFLEEDYGLEHLQYYNVKTKGDYRNYYSTRTAKMVFEYYKRDIETFKYEEEYKSLMDYLKNKGI